MTPKIGCVGHDCAECKARKAMRPTVPDNMQDWKGMDGTIAWHLIERHADNWADVGKMMDEWFAANQAQPQPMNSWQQAIDDEMVTLHLGGAWGDPKACLKELLDWHVSVALDPSVSSDAASLVDRGRAEAKTRVATLEALVSELDRESRQNWALYVEVSADARALQAKLDRLMFEYCPEDMTAEQVETWAKHQRMNRSLETLKKVNQG